MGEGRKVWGFVMHEGSIESHRKEGVKVRDVKVPGLR